MAQTGANGLLGGADWNQQPNRTEPSIQDAASLNRNCMYFMYCMYCTTNSKGSVITIEYR